MRNNGERLVKVMEMVKNIAAILGLILSFFAVVTLLSKNVRSFLSKIIRKYSNSSESEKTIGEIKQMLEQHIKDDETFKKEIQEVNEITLEFTKTQCRNNIKNIFYKYNDTKCLPLYEKKTLMSIEDLYIGKLHCNSFAGFLLEEMKKWDVDYESEHVPSENNID